VIRKAFIFQLKPGSESEYARRHNPIWPELESLLRDRGVTNYSIFLERATLKLFGYVEIKSVESWESIARTDVCRRWWAEMSELMETNDDLSPRSVDLEEVFHMD
jgi:L-rhamnose mutarotase